MWFTPIYGLRFYFETKEELERFVDAMRPLIKLTKDEADESGKPVLIWKRDD